MSKKSGMTRRDFHQKEYYERGRPCRARRDQFYHSPGKKSSAQMTAFVLPW